MVVSNIKECKIYFCAKNNFIYFNYISIYLFIIKILFLIILYQITYILKLVFKLVSTKHHIIKKLVHFLTDQHNWFYFILCYLSFSSCQTLLRLYF